jgi:hypothetical protein
LLSQLSCVDLFKILKKKRKKKRKVNGDQQNSDHPFHV